jgi:hypothetical protein
MRARISVWVAHAQGGTVVQGMVLATSLACIGSLGFKAELAAAQSPL